MSELELEVLVVGGGITGTGAALDAVTRGLRTGLIEARDYASGTSSKSSKLIHGGLRYLEMLDFGLVREALRERELLLTRLAPHLVKPVPFLWPLTHRGWERAYLGAGPRALRPARRRAQRALDQAPLAPRCRADRAWSAAGRLRGRRAVLRRAGGRRASRRLRRAHRAAVRRLAGDARGRDRLPAARAGGSSASPRTTRRPASISRSARARCSAPPASGRTSCASSPAAAPARASAPRRGSTSSCREIASRWRRASSCGPSGACSSSSPGGRTGSSATRTRPGSSTATTPRPRARTSTTCSRRRTGCCCGRSCATTSRASSSVCGPSSARARTRTPPASAARTRSSRPCPG